VYLWMATRERKNLLCTSIFTMPPQLSTCLRPRVDPNPQASFGTDIGLIERWLSLLGMGVWVVLLHK